jgi:mono/diheme cytochrome c family protein
MKVASFLVLGIALAACGEKADPGGPGDDDIDVDGGEVTYAEDIKPMLDSNCISCHAAALNGADRNGAPLGVDFDTYTAAVDSGEQANTRIKAGTMPPSGPLSGEEMSLFQAWVDQDFPE